MAECHSSFIPSCWSMLPACPAAPRRGASDSILEVSPGTALDLPGILDTTSLGSLQQNYKSGRTIKVLYGEEFATTPGELFKLK